ncbi:thioredoxin-disulfide reductase [Candidatus Gracilibacteria bacterium]|nr:thioredoxin-disulfide reductase [Candidatus Gracilibacteria bacterium]
MQKEKLIIIGSGPAGLTAAVYSARADLKPLVFEGETPGGQLMGTTEIENWPGAQEGLMGPQLMNQMREQAKRFGARTEFKKIEKVDFSDAKNLKLWSGDEEYRAEAVIIATGASARWLKLGKGEEKYWGKGYTACATCDGAFYRDKVVAVVGGGDSACEEAHFLTRFASKVYQIYRGPKEKMRASKPMQKRVFEHEKIEMIFNKNVTDLRGEEKLQSVELTDSETNETSELKIDGLFMAIGHNPNTGIFEGQLDLHENRYLEVTDNTKSRVPSVFIAGDCADWRYRQAVTAAGYGCMAALDTEKYLESLKD